LVVIGIAAPVEAEEQILRFESAVSVGGNGVLDVVETIEVRAEGDRIRHGIYRDFPLTFLGDNGASHSVSFRLLDITRDGAAEAHHSASNADGIRIYAGDEDVVLEPGVYTYRFHYQTGRQIRFLPDHTELFWNVTGNDWDFPILSATSKIVLPNDAVPSRWAAYTGRYGERGRAFTGSVRGINTLTVETTGTLAPGEGLSVVAEIPPGVVALPTALQSLYYRFLDNRRWIIGGLGLAGVFVFYFLAWNAVGRDPPKGTIIPQFHPPEGISPALAAYIRQYGWRSGWREFTAAAISLAVNGLIVFDDSTDTIVLSRTAANAPTLPPGERSILRWIEDRNGKVEIDKANGKSIATALSAFKSSVEAESRNRFFHRNRGYFYGGIVLTAAAVALVIAFGGLRDNEMALLIGAGAVGIFMGSVLVPIVRALFGVRRVFSVVSAAINLAVVIFIGTVFVTLARGALADLPDDFGHSILTVLLSNSFPFVLVGGFATMNGLFYYLLRAPTAAGRTVMDDIEGLDLYIRTAETGRFNLAGAPDFDATHFESLLPYALALDAEKPWSEAFARAFTRAHPGEEEAVAYAPGWHGGHSWSGQNFSSAVSSSVSAAQGSFASSVPTPSSSSSGFGGGGGSGGGGGGGGGGGW
jgi:uncharacterized membrane protein YgcG